MLQFWVMSFLPCGEQKRGETFLAEDEIFYGFSRKSKCPALFMCLYFFEKVYESTCLDDRAPNTAFAYFIRVLLL
jgi:hypothetical protein